MGEAAPPIDVETPHSLPADAASRYAADGFVTIHGVLSRAELAHFSGPVSRAARARAWNRDIPFEKRGTYERAFLQAGNLWEYDDTIRALSFSKRLARIATELLGVSGVRMYHDQALYKEAGYGLTPWHVDQQYWPLASDRAITAWIPFQDVPKEMGPVVFGRGSHRLEIARDLRISDESDVVIAEAVAARGIEEVAEPFVAGDVSFHAGWTLHRAGPNSTDRARCVHTVIYIDQDMRLAEPCNDAQRLDWRVWSPSTAVGEVMDDPRNPVLYRVGGDR